MTGPTVLVVDDQPLNLYLLSFLLSAHGYDVMTAADAHEAIAAIGRQRPALILMDMQMPGIDGFELTGRLKADPVTAAVPIVAVTSFAMSGDKERALQAGCDGYIPKPIDTRALPADVAGYLSEADRARLRLVPPERPAG
jgi:CheY-like chemotaxis protein